jgi:hypothetical protein
MEHEKEIPTIFPEQQKELVNILMDSDLYLDLPLEERHLLLKYILDSYLFPASVEGKKDPSRSSETGLSLRISGMQVKLR